MLTRLSSLFGNLREALGGSRRGAFLCFSKKEKEK